MNYNPHSILLNAPIATQEKSTVVNFVLEAGWLPSRIKLITGPDITIYCLRKSALKTTSLYEWSSQLFYCLR